MAVENTKYIAGLDATQPTGSSPKSEGDDQIRQLKDVFKNSFTGFDGPVLMNGTEAQGADANEFVVTVAAPAPTAYAANMMVSFRATHANTGAATLRIGALEAKPLLYPDGNSLRANTISATSRVLAQYDGAYFRIMGGGNAQAVYDYIAQVQFESALPGMASQGGKFLSTNGTDAQWKAALPVYSSTPTANEGPIYRTGIGAMEWQGAAYAQVYTKTSIGLGNVDNTSDAAKPISTATQTALNAKAPIASPIFTGTARAGTLVSEGPVYSATAYLYMNGDVIGAVWGGSMRDWVVNSLAGKQGAGNYASSSDGNVYTMGWDGSYVYAGVNGAVARRLWDSATLNPASFKAAGNYVKDFSGVERVGFSWNGSAIVVWIDGVGRGTLSFTPF